MGLLLFLRVVGLLETFWTNLAPFDEIDLFCPCVPGGHIPVLIFDGYQSCLDPKFEAGMVILVFHVPNNVATD
jgi:hypothetical protein